MVSNSLFPQCPYCENLVVKAIGNCNKIGTFTICDFCGGLFYTWDDGEGDYHTIKEEEYIKCLKRLVIL